MTRRRAFTLIELLVVIAIIGVLVAMLLPAVQQVRDAANRAACSNHLKQLTLAAVNHHDAAGWLPAAGTTTPKQHGWAVYLLPYLEQQSLYDRYDFGHDWSDPANAAVVNTPLAVMTCPSSPSRRAAAGTPAPGDYLPTRGVNPILAGQGLVPTVADYKGIMRLDRQSRLVDVLDGTSNTILFAEAAGRPQRWEMNQAVPGVVSAGGAWASFDNQATLEGYDSATRTAIGPCAVNCSNDNALYGFHRGGAQVALADGSVKLFRSSASITVVAAMVTRAGGEVVQDAP